MGTKMGPSYANLFVGFIEHKFFSQYHGPKPLAQPRPPSLLRTQNEWCYKPFAFEPSSTAPSVSRLKPQSSGQTTDKLTRAELFESVFIHPSLRIILTRQLS